MNDIPTPRTDAVKRLYHSSALNNPSYEYVYADFALQLERELAQAQQREARLREALKKYSEHKCYCTMVTLRGCGCNCGLAEALSQSPGETMVKCDDCKPGKICDACYSKLTPLQLDELGDDE